MQPSFGLLCMVVSCLAFSAMGALIYAQQLVEPDVSSLVASFVRIVVNLSVVVATSALAGEARDLIGDRRASLWARGGFGSIALIFSFAAIRAIGVGEATFLTSSSGVFVAMFAPFFLMQPNSPKVWVAIGGAVFGLFLLFEPRIADAYPLGRALALTSGLCSALAYMMIARAGTSNRPNSVIFYLCIVALPVHLAAFLVLETVWPTRFASWALLGAAGILGSVGQYFLTRAYQNAPAALNSAVSYLLPVVNTIVGVVAFDRHPDQKAWVGALVVVVFGVMLPFVRLPVRTAGSPS